MLRAFQTTMRPKIALDLGHSEIRIAILGKENSTLPFPSYQIRNVRLLTEFIKKHLGYWLRLRPDLYFLVDPCDSHERQLSVRDIGTALGAHRVYRILRPLAHVKSLNTVPWGTVLVDIGAEAVVISTIQEGSVLQCHEIQSGGKALDQHLIQYLRRNYYLNISLQTAENMKKSTSPAHLISAIQSQTGVPVRALIYQEELMDAWQPVLQSWTEAIQQSLYQSSYKLVECLKVEGIFITGGGALLNGLNEYLASALNISVTRLQAPLQSALIGAEHWMNGIKLPECLKKY
ncbi:MAG: rod shape-determining protein [Gammaproteobacteria bacterium]